MSESGLRNPGAAARGLGAGALVMEVIVLLLAIQPLRLVGGGLSRPAVITVLVLAVVSSALAARMAHEWAWRAGAGLQVALVAAGLLHWALGVLGVVFGIVWWYLMRVRRALVG
ncbi:DUF4233 domain-containing protein [Pilimelia columellifera]|uniref:DUF4233 domain-containing protein n=1 Tax=Pilimelia columellifera subsp. columellifera TaxID=706583 RepID=A0ABN3NQ08_9ACTN